MKYILILMALMSLQMVGQNPAIDSIKVIYKLDDPSTNQSIEKITIYKPKTKSNFQIHPVLSFGISSCLSYKLGKSVNNVTTFTYNTYASIPSLDFYMGYNILQFRVSLGYYSALGIKFGTDNVYGEVALIYRTFNNSFGFESTVGVGFFTNENKVLYFFYSFKLRTDYPTVELLPVNIGFRYNVAKQ